MSKTVEFPDLEKWWYEAGPDDLVCCACQRKIGASALARTFRLNLSPRGDHESSSKYTKIIETPLGENLVIYDRHLHCLLQSGVKYSSVSHVWDPEISRIQNLGRHSPQPLEACRLVVQLPVFLYTGLLRGNEISEQDEVWCDYVSVPQWSDNLKNRILLAIPQIYGSSSMTRIHFNDLSKQSIRMLYEGETTFQRLKGITDIRNLVWFSRVWTAMEFVRSNRVISIDKDYDVCPDRNDPIYMNQLHRVWAQELSKHESVHQLEHRAGMGKNLVPWNLGPLTGIEQRKSAVFGQAFSLVSKRRCRSNHDFLHALLGLVGTTSDRPLEYDFKREYAHIARLCLAAGDYSPLLMSPRRLRSMMSGSDFHGEFCFDNYDLENGDPILKLQKIGVVSQVYRRLGASPIAEFAHDAYITLQSTGPDLYTFIETLGSRLYDEDAASIKSKLFLENQIDKLTYILRVKHNQGKGFPIEGPDGARWVAEAMKFTSSRGSSANPASRLAFLMAHGGTIHCGFASGPGGHNCLISVACPGCRRSFLFRAGLFESPDSVKGLVAYRIPGLKFDFSHWDGVRILLKDGRVMGRMVWATPACHCFQFEKVQIKIPDLPDRSPRPFVF
ncbi:hypothetical protein HYALB_00013112 [Hymenoscyphus albidus]|uniref:Heterokaryon incompatibility domain-containing protein n=1 Tax=Hymenoscyphus albidus TaxID=595503 RepID=A0A9N9LRA8_9HELO|nr:hypothetical protein HYALB_00013112 [Hymenoscyphus albidus]